MYPHTYRDLHQKQSQKSRKQKCHQDSSQISAQEKPHYQVFLQTIIKQHNYISKYGTLLLLENQNITQ